MTLAFTRFAESIDVAQYDGTNASDVRAWIESVCGVGTTSMIGNVIVNPVSAIHPGDRILPVPGGTFTVQDNTTFLAGHSALA